MWLLYNRFTISRKIDDPSNEDLVDEIGKICYQWATTRDCFSKTPNLSKWKPGMNRTWPSSKSLPRLIVEDRVTDALLDWKDLPDYLCEFRDLRLTLHQRGEIQDLDEEFIHHIHIKRVDEVVEFSILQDMPTDEDTRDWPDIKGIYPPKLFNEIINNYDCAIKDYIINNCFQITDNSIEIDRYIFDKKRRVPLILIPKYFLDDELGNDEFSSFFRKISSFAELCIYEGEDFYTNFQTYIGTDENFATIFSPNLDESDLSYSISKKIIQIPYNDDFLSTSNDIVNDIMKRTHTMKLRSELSIKVDNALSEKQRKIEEENSQKKIDDIINKNNTIEEKNNDLLSRLRLTNNQLMDANKEITKFQRENEKLIIQKDGAMKKYNDYKMRFNQVKTFQDNLISKARENNLSREEAIERIKIALEGNKEKISEEIEYSCIFDLVKDLRSRNSNIIFSHRALSSAKNADNTGRYSSENFTIKKIELVFDKINEHFFGDGHKNIRHIDFHKEMAELFPGKYSDESRITLDNIKKYSGNNRRIFEVSLPDKGELGIEMTWHIKVTGTIRINICCINHAQKSIPLWSKHEGRWIRNHEMEKGNYFGDDKGNYPKIIVGYCGVHLKTVSIK